MVAQLYDLLHLLWTTYHFSQKCQGELKAVGKKLAVNISNPSSVKSTHWIPRVEHAMYALLRPAGQDEQHSGQYAATLQHMSHTSPSSASADVKGKAKKVIYFGLQILMLEL